VTIAKKKIKELKASLSQGTNTNKQRRASHPPARSTERERSVIIHLTLTPLPSPQPLPRHQPDTWKATIIGDPINGDPTSTTRLNRTSATSSGTAPWENLPEAKPWNSTIVTGVGVILVIACAVTPLTVTPTRIFPT